MSFSLTLSELANIAIGTPEAGNVNFNALHILLHSILEHLQLQDIRKEILEEEKDFLKPSSGLTLKKRPTQQADMEGKSSSLFHQMQQRLGRIESQLIHLNDTPSTAELLTRSQSFNKPAEDMWQMMQLKKKMEMNEEGMTKAMNTLQDLLTNIYSLKTTVDAFQNELRLLKDKFHKDSMGEIGEQLALLDRHSQIIQTILDKLGDLQEELSSFPKQADLVQWSCLFKSLADKSLSEQGHSLESKQEMAREALSKLTQLPEQHKALETRVSKLESQLQEQANHIANMGSSADLAAELKRMQDELSSLQNEEEKRLDFRKNMLAQMQKLKEQCEKLQKVTERLLSNTGDIQNLREMVKQLNLNKADKTLLEQEMNVKADKSELETKVDHDELQSATTQLNEMMQDLLQKMSLQDKEWQKVLQNLFIDMDSKLDRVALDPLKKQLEEVWKFIKKYLSEGPHFDADSAAGFKKQLFERVKCISCDRPVMMTTGPHLVTVRKARLYSRTRPASANGYEYLAQKQQMREQALEKKDRSETTSHEQQSSQHCWQCQAHATYPAERYSNPKTLTTIYPYGDPAVLTYDNTEVDILGINGVLYKGRMSSQAAKWGTSLDKEFPATVARMRAGSVSGKQQPSQETTLDVPIQQATPWPLPGDRGMTGM
ncbi:uncharacterized protein C16orf96 homolog [Alligator mississippiensis]|uniref:DUF4795 domain-containing protein n=1 Tax=Alligator mississippiensis TaxID=8496 RepID=A0A151NGL7_ALLMI|nr:uncharacterized protein C16orf96 homolog [Alligator mississippiensis]KYO35938.1 hypothetical protein Y1Q_0009285 [Alligator mississippiensis]